MQSIIGDWKLWVGRNVDDLQSPAQMSRLRWIAIFICTAVFIGWLIR
ncbi:MAG: hypothetical protein ACLQJR_32005 [Stellaceae bacterium]